MEEKLESLGQFDINNPNSENLNSNSINSVEEPLEINSDSDSDSKSKIQQFDKIENPDNNKRENEVKDKDKDKDKKKGCHFPSAYTILIVIEIIVFFLTYIVPKGKYDTIEYDSDKDIFIIKSPNKDDEERNATKEILIEKGIKIPLDNFIKGHIKKPVSIPNTYKKIEGETTNFFHLFLYPILGLIESSDNSFFLIILGGVINILIEMKAFSAAMSALTRKTKGKEFLLFCLVFVIISICGTTFGMAEEIFAFYPILMPIFLKSGLDGILSMSSLIMGSIMGCMFSTVNAFNVVLGSYSAGISFTNGIVFRVFAFLIGDVIVLFYFYVYYKRIQKNEKKSIVYDIKENLEKKFLKKDKEDKEEKEKKEKEESTNEDNNLIPSEKKEEENKLEFTFIQILAILIFLSGFVIMIIGVLFLDWWFEHMSAIFFTICIILMFFLKQGESKAIETFTKGAGDFIGVAFIIGIARGINITLKEGKIEDTILYGLTKSTSKLNKVSFAIIMLFIFIFIGFFINSMTALAVLAMPVLAPLADDVGCSRTVVINAYMFGQNFIGLVAPTGLILIVLQLVDIQFNYWIKFIWPLMVILLIYLIILMMLNAAF